MTEEIKPVQAYQIFPAHWVPLSHDLREYLAAKFGVGRSVATEIVDNRIISDGRSPNDLKNITLEKMQEYTGSKIDDFMQLWAITVSKATSELNPPKEITTKVEKATVDKPVETVEKKEPNGFRPATEKEIAVHDIITKNANDKSTTKKQK